MVSSRKLFYRWGLALLLTAGLALSAPLAANAEPQEAAPSTANADPQEVVRSTADAVLHEVETRRSELEAAPEQIYALVEQYVLPNFDFELMSRLALGRHWASATPEQQAQFTEGFRELLVRTYATALLNYSGQKITYLPFELPADAERVRVPTQVFAAPGSPPVPVDYELFQRDDAWRVYDVRIDGISMLQNYRTSFTNEIRRYQLSGLIERISDKNKGLE